jgi:hypothetical protein
LHQPFGVLGDIYYLECFVTMLTDIGDFGFLLFRHFSIEQVFSYNFNLLFYGY